jgi:hypothetical protein
MARDKLNERPKDMMRMMQHNGCQGDEIAADEASRQRLVPRVGQPQGQPDIGDPSLRSAQMRERISTALRLWVPKQNRIRACESLMKQPQVF